MRPMAGAEPPPIVASARQRNTPEMCANSNNYQVAWVQSSVVVTLRVSQLSHGYCKDLKKK